MLFLATALVIAAFAVPALLLHRHYDDGIAKMGRQVSTQTAFNGLRPRLTEKLELLKKRDVKKMYLKGASSALALAELQETVRATIEASGGRVMNSSSVQSITPKEDGSYRQIAAIFTLNANSQNLRRLLYALETKEPYLLIDSIVIQPSIQSGFRPAPEQPSPKCMFSLTFARLGCGHPMSQHRSWCRQRASARHRVWLRSKCVVQKRQCWKVRARHELIGAAITSSSRISVANRRAGSRPARRHWH